MTIIMKTLFGSHLYGTNTPESDTDYKGVFLPTKNQILLGKIPRQEQKHTNIKRGKKNTKEDIDYQIFSLHYFIYLACQGETAALDMLHATDKTIIEKHSLWDDIVKNRSKFYTKNLKAFIGYAQRQAAKYGVKGSRLNAAKIVIKYLESKGRHGCSGVRLIDIWHKLPEGEHIYKHKDMYEVCHKKMNKTVTIGYALDIVNRFHDNYGDRAKKAAKNIGVDWKAMSHALRVAYQVRAIFTEGTIPFPLKQAGFIRNVKLGNWEFSFVLKELEELIVECKELSEKSNLPEKVDIKFWDNFIINAMETYVL